MTKREGCRVKQVNIHFRKSRSFYYFVDASVYLNGFLLLDSVEVATARWRWKRVFFSNPDTTVSKIELMPLMIGACVMSITPVFEDKMRPSPLRIVAFTSHCVVLRSAESVMAVNTRNRVIRKHSANHCQMARPSTFISGTHATDTSKKCPRLILITGTREKKDCQTVKFIRIPISEDFHFVTGSPRPFICLDNLNRLETWTLHRKKGTSALDFLFILMNSSVVYQRSSVSVSVRTFVLEGTYNVVKYSNSHVIKVLLQKVALLVGHDYVSNFLKESDLVDLSYFDCNQ